MIFKFVKENRRDRKKNRTDRKKNRKGQMEQVGCLDCKIINFNASRDCLK
jgi:hypothetical protein